MEQEGAGHPLTTLVVQLAAWAGLVHRPCCCLTADYCSLWENRRLEAGRAPEGVLEETGRRWAPNAAAVKCC